MYPGEEPVPKRGWQWWQYLLAGCGGCGFLLLLTVIAVGVFGFSMAKSVMEGEKGLTPEVVRQRLGRDVPLPKDAELRLDETRIVSGTLNLVLKAAGQSGDGRSAAAGIYDAPGSPSEILATYEKKMPRLGWKRSKKSEDSSLEQHWVKDSDALSVTVEASGAGAEVMLVRGGAALLDADFGGAGQE